MAKLTVKELQALRLADAGQKLREDGGILGVVRAKASGEVSVKWDWRYRFDGKVRQLALGTWPKDSMPEIRKKREQMLALLAAGKDPAEEKRTQRLEARANQAEAIAEQHRRIASATAVRARITVSDLFERWTDVELIRRKDAGKEIRRMFTKDVLPIIGTLAVEDVRKGHITSVTDALLARGVTRMAKMIFSLMRQMFRFAVDRDIIESDPTATIRKAKIGGKETERDRVLSESEIRDLQAKVRDAHLIPSTEIAIWLCLATCCRIGELLLARWRDVDLDAREWRIPAEVAKNKKAHTVYLSDFAVAKFRELYAITGTVVSDEGMTKPAEWCYPDRHAANAVCVKTVTKQIGDRQRGDKTPMSRRTPHKSALLLLGGKWTPHDLRRTGATIMTALGVLPEVAERCLNHTEENKVKRIYQRHNYQTEMRQAWVLLGDRLGVLTSDSDNVLTMKREAA